MFPDDFRRERTSAKRGIVGALVCGALILTPSFASAAAEPDDTPEIIGAHSDSAIEGEYIVVLKEQKDAHDVDHVAQDLADAVGGEVLDTFSAALDGYTAMLSEEEALTVAADERVDFVEQSQVITAFDEQADPPAWGLDRIDQRMLPLDQSYTYPDSAGAGVNVYIVDSGIRRSHSEFAGRMKPGFDAIVPGGTADDCNGHGTHVAGTAVGSTYGVAKKANVYPVRVLGCSGSGSTSGIVKAIEWLTANAVKPATANYSVGCSSACSSPATDQAVKNLIASGVTWVQAAGNSNDDACLYSPQLLPEGITVGNSTRTDEKASSSNWGPCLDVWAPGTGILSAWFTGDNATRSISGTSMASPHVTGAAALYLGENPSATPAQVQDALVGNATTGTLTGVDPSSPNRLLYTGPAETAGN